MTTNTKAGFSIVYYTGTGFKYRYTTWFNAKPNFITKAFDDGDNWDVYHWQAPNNHQNAHQSTLQLNNNSVSRNVLHQDVGDTKIPVTQFYIGGVVMVNVWWHTCSTRWKDIVDLILM